MSTPSRGQPAARPGQPAARTGPVNLRRPAGSWRAAGPEIAIAAVLTAAAATTGYAVAGVAGATVVLVAAAAAALLTVRALLPASDPASGDDYLPAYTRSSLPFTGYWRRRVGLSEGTRSLVAFDAELRGTLQNLLAARLAERHGISLQDDPGAARRLLCPAPADESLWHWVDPGRPTVTSGNQPGIPPRMLARLVDRLERL